MNIFLSVPFTSKVDPNGNVEASYRDIIEHLLADLRAKGHAVFCSLEFAEWKFGGLSLPEDEFRKDLAEIDKADKVIVLLEERISAGIQIENGYAFAKGKVIESYQSGKPAWSNIAFSRLNGHEIVVIQSIEDFAKRVLENN